MINKFHPTAIISAQADIALDVEIGPYTIIHDDVEIAEGSVIGSHCEIGIKTPLAKTSKLVIGKNSTIRSHTVFYQGGHFGDKLITGHHVCVRENITAGDSFQIGTQTELQGDTVIGNYVRTQSGVFIPKHTTLGNFIWLMPNVTLTNDPHPPSDYEAGPTIKDYSVIAANATILPEIVIETHALVAAGSVVTKNIETGAVYAGVPAKKIADTSDINLKDKSISAYPWPEHFERGYPEEIIRAWKNKDY